MILGRVRLYLVWVNIFNLKKSLQILLMFTSFSILLIAQKSFVKIEGGDFSYAGSDFRFLGFNAYYLHDIYFDNSKRNVIEEVFQFAQNYNFKVIRTWAFNETVFKSAIMKNPYELSERGLEALDYILWLADKYNIKLILTLANNHRDYGGIPKYIEWANSRLSSSYSHTDFFTNDSIKAWYKFYISSILDRVNSLKGIKYKDDPAIFSFELINEAVCHFTNPQIIYNWYFEMGQFFNSIDPDHLLTTGEQGYDNYNHHYSDIDLFYNSADFLLNGMKGTSYVMNSQIEFIDYTSYHLYADLWGMNYTAGNTWIRDHDRIAGELNKPALMGEFGVKFGDSSIIKQFLDVLKYCRSESALIWSYRHPDIPFDDGYGFNEIDNPELIAIFKEYSDQLELGVPAEEIPAGISLYQNFPNPFNPTTTITYSLENDEYVKLTLYNSLGEKIGILDEGIRNAGLHKLSISANSGYLASGIYIYTLQTEKEFRSKKMNILK